MGSADGRGEPRIECGLGEAEATVDAHRPGPVDHDQWRHLPVDPACGQLSAVTLDVVEPADPVAVGLSCTHGAGDARGHYVPGAVADQSP